RKTEQLAKGRVAVDVVASIEDLHDLVEPDEKGDIPQFGERGPEDLRLIDVKAAVEQGDRAPGHMPSMQLQYEQPIRQQRALWLLLVDGQRTESEDDPTGVGALRGLGERDVGGGEWVE